MTDNTIDSEVRLEEAKRRMEWNEERYGEPTILEYLRYYKSGVIGEIHIEAAIAQEANKARLDEIQKIVDWGKTVDDQWNAHFKERLKELLLTADKEETGGQM